MPEIEKVVGPILPPAAPQTQQTGRTQDTGFAQALQQEQLKLSGHAQTRLRGRNIGLTSEDWNRVSNGVGLAAAKGSRESLILLDDVALVVSVRNRTVITAVDKDNLKENVFTNIDSAVIV
jgi:flagellar operon protein